MTVHHLTGSKVLITLLNRMGHCSSYDELQTVDTSLPIEVLAKTEEYGTIIPSNIFPGLFVQIAADNNDLNEETLDEKNTTHGTTMVVYQWRQSTAVADHATRRRSLQTSGSVYEIQQCSAHGRLPVEYVNAVDKEWYNGQCATYSTASNNVTWDLLRLNP